jgi:hypothetical protein
MSASTAFRGAARSGFVGHAVTRHACLMAQPFALAVCGYVAHTVTMTLP